MSQKMIKVIFADGTTHEVPQANEKNIREFLMKSEQQAQIISADVISRQREQVKALEEKFAKKREEAQKPAEPSLHDQIKLAKEKALAEIKAKQEEKKPEPLKPTPAKRIRRSKAEIEKSKQKINAKETV
jgi:colicin import membrane protein